MLTCEYCKNYRTKDHLCPIKEDFVTAKSEACSAFERAKNFFCAKNSNFLEFEVCIDRRNVRKHKKCKSCKQYSQVKEASEFSND